MPSNLTYIGHVKMLVDDPKNQQLPKSLLRTSNATLPITLASMCI